MTECLAVTPLHIIIDLEATFIPDGWNTQVNAHPKTSVGRLLEYLKYQLRARISDDNLKNNDRPRDNLDEYGLICMYDNEQLSNDKTLQDIERQKRNHFLRFEVRVIPIEKESSTSTNSNFSEVNIKFELNVLSAEKIASRMYYGVKLDTSLLSLQKMALEYLKTTESELSEKENTEAVNFCAIRSKHELGDFEGFFVKGRHTPIQLMTNNDTQKVIDDEFSDLTLRDFLSLDLLPNNDSFLTLMFKVSHNHEIADDECPQFTIHFVSEAHLLMDHMNVSEQSTVMDVKYFICSVYGHALRVTPQDVKLIYKGQLLHEKNSRGDLTKIMDHVNDPNDSKIHVNISQEFHVAGPGFWTELFTNPNIFAHFNTDNLNSATSATPRSASNPSKLDGPVDDSVGLEDVKEQTKKDVEFVTESGSKIEILEGLYRRCLIDGKECFVALDALDEINAKLHVAGEHEIKLYSDDYMINEDKTVSLSLSVKKQIQHKTGKRVLLHNSMSTSEHSVTVGAHANDNQSNFRDPQRSTQIESIQINNAGLAPTPTQQALRNDIEPLGSRLRRRLLSTLPVLFLVLRTLYLIAYNCVVIVFVVLDFGTFLPWKYTILIVLLFILRTVWNTQEIWTMWSAYLRLDEISDNQMVKIKEYVVSGKLSVSFYDKFRQTPNAFLYLMSDALRSERLALYEKFGFDEADGASLIERVFNQATDNHDHKDALDKLVRESVRVYERQLPLLNEDERNSAKAMLRLILKDREERYCPSQPGYRRLWSRLRTVYTEHLNAETLRDVLRCLVPNPPHDNIAIALIKNVALMAVLVLPLVRDQVDGIIEERARNNATVSDRNVSASEGNTPTEIHDDPSGSTEQPRLDEDIAAEESIATGAESSRATPEREHATTTQYERSHDDTQIQTRNMRDSH